LPFNNFLASPELLSDVIDLISKTQSDLPQFKFLKQKKYIKEYISYSVNWCAKCTDFLYIKRYDEKIIAASIWIPPGADMARVDSNLIKNRSILTDLYEFIRTTTSRSSVFWELLDFAPILDPQDNSNDYLIEVLSPVFSQADKARIPIYYFTSDMKRVDILSKWKFEIIDTTISKKTTIYALYRLVK